MYSAAPRPETLEEMVGQEEVLARLRIVLAGARAREVKIPHVLLSGPAGYGKTTLARMLAHDLGGELIATSGPVLRRVADLAGLLMSAEPGAAIFIDEIHRMPMAVEEVLYEALEDGTLSVIIGQGDAARAVAIKLPSVTFIGATTRPGALSAPLRGRFGFHAQLQVYTTANLGAIVRRFWQNVQQEEADEAASVVVAERAKGVPRLALHLAARVLDVAAIQRLPVTAELAVSALEAFGIGADGLDETDIRILDALCRTFRGRAVGLDALAQALDLDTKTIEEEHEGPLVRAGLMVRTHAGRVATPQAHELVRAPALAGR